MQFSIFPLLGLLFIGLKLAGVIAWSWWLVLLPFYAGLLIAIIFLAALYGTVFLLSLWR